MSLPRLTLLFTTLFALLLSPAVAAEHPAPPAPPAPEELFKTFDVNHDGALSKGEFSQGMEALHKRMGPPPPRGDDQSQERKPPKGGDDERRPPPRDEGDQPSGAAEHPPREGGGKEGGKDGRKDGGTKKGGPGKRLEETFTAVDTDKSGTLTMEEFKAALKALRPPPRREDN